MNRKMISYNTSRSSFTFLLTATEVNQTIIPPLKGSMIFSSLVLRFVCIHDISLQEIFPAFNSMERISLLFSILRISFAAILYCALITTNISIFNKKDFTEHPKSLYPQEPGSAGSLKRSVIWLSLSRFKTSPHIRPSPLDNMYKIF